MGYQSEYALEEEVIKQLVKQGYERIKIRDDAQLVNHFRKILMDTFGIRQGAVKHRYHLRPVKFCLVNLT